MERDVVQDPVCGMRLERADAVAASEWLGRTFHFCSQMCRALFDADPGAHAGAHTESHTVRKVRIPLVGLACAAGDRLPVEKELRGVSGVLEAYVNPADETAHLSVDPERFRIQDAEAALERLGARGVVTGAPRLRS